MDMGKKGGEGGGATKGQTKKNMRKVDSRIEVNTWGENRSKVDKTISGKGHWCRNYRGKVKNKGCIKDGAGKGGGEPPPGRSHGRCRDLPVGGI